MPDVAVTWSDKRYSYGAVKDTSGPRQYNSGKLSGARIQPLVPSSVAYRPSPGDRTEHPNRHASEKYLIPKSTKSIPGILRSPGRGAFFVSRSFLGANDGTRVVRQSSSIPDISSIYHDPPKHAQYRIPTSKYS